MKIKPTEGSYKSQAILIDMKPTTRQTKFKANALAQVSQQINDMSKPLMLNHDTSRLPSGRWYEAKVTDTSEVVAKFYIPHEIPEHIDITSRIETGLLDSVSIGFSSKIHECSICTNDISDWPNCDHIPGREYDGETCYVLLDDITMQEASLVYVGAVPDAKIKSEYAARYDGYNSKEAFCKDFIFEEGTIETITCGSVSQEQVEIKQEGNAMDLQANFDSLQNNYTALAAKYADLNTKYLNGSEQFAADRVADIKNIKDLTAELTVYKDKLASADKDLAELKEFKTSSETLTTEKEALTASAETYVTKLHETVAKLAAPFEAEAYAETTNVDKLFADLATYMEKAKALPAGRQSIDDNAEQYGFKPNDSIYKGK